MQGAIKLVLLLLVGIACDLWTEAQDLPAAKKIEEPRTNVSGDRGGLALCLAECRADHTLSPTDQATCRLNCESGHKVAPTPKDEGRWEQAARCLGGCYEAPGEQKVCFAGCGAALRGTLGGGAEATLDQLTACVGECHADQGLQPTDRATCRLTCAQAAKVVAKVAAPPGSEVPAGEKVR